MYSNELRIKFPLSHCFPLPSASFPHSTVHSCVHTAVHLSSIVESFVYVLSAYAKEKSARLIQLASTASGPLSWYGVVGVYFVCGLKSNCFFY